jgi:hypothetical protein
MFLKVMLTGQAFTSLETIEIAESATVANFTALNNSNASSNNTESEEVVVNETIEGNVTANPTIEQVEVRYNHTTTVGIPQMSEADKADLAAA